MDNRRKGKKSNIQLDGRIIAYCVVILFTVLLPVLGLPSFRAEKTSTASGIISNISVERSSFGKAKRKVLYFDLDQSAYYFPLTNVVNQSEIDSLLCSLRACEQDQTPVSVKVTDEMDYRDVLISNGRSHAFSLTFGAQSISPDIYKKDVSFLRMILFGFAFVLSIPVAILFRLGEFSKKRKN